MTTFPFEKTAHRCIVCNTFQLSESDFRVSQFCQVVRAEAQFTWGGIVKRLLIAYFIGNIYAQKYQNPFMSVKVIASQQGGTFFATRCIGLQWFGSLVVRAFDSRLNGRGSNSRPLRQILGWVIVFGRATSVFHQASQANSASYPQQTGNEYMYQPKCGDSLRLAVKDRHSLFNLWINAWVAGKTVISR